MTAPAEAPAGADVDTSCRHAALARLLRRLDPVGDPGLALGDTADTRARRTGGRLAFVDLLPALAGSLQTHGWLLHRHDLQGRDDQASVATVLASGRAVVVDADTFHLPHYYLDYRQVHALHAIVLEDHDPATATVRVIDAVDASFFDGRMRLADLVPAMLSGHGQTWWELHPAVGVEPWEPALLRTGLPARIGELVGGGDPGTASGTELAEFLIAHLGEYAGAGNRGGMPAADADVSRARSAGSVMWNYHHTLRWFARFLEAVAADNRATRAAAAAARTAAQHLTAAAQDWLVARNVLLRAVVSDRDRLERFAEKVAQRLWSGVAHTERGAVVLETLRSGA